MNQVAERGNGQEPISAEVMERVLIGGDLAKLSNQERLSYYDAVCRSVGLNPLTKPFAYISLNGKLQLYALKDCTEQLRKLHGVSIERLERQSIEGVYVVTAYAKDKSGRTDGSTGAVTVTGLKGDALANAFMKAETKAKRRVTLSICGMGVLDETEVETIPGAAVMQHDAIPISPTSGMLESLPPSDQIELGKIVGEVRQKLTEESADAAFDLLESFALDGDHKQALWGMLERAEKQALRRVGERRK